MGSTNRTSLMPYAHRGVRGAGHAISSYYANKGLNAQTGAIAGQEAAMDWQAKQQGLEIQRQKLEVSRGQLEATQGQLGVAQGHLNQRLVEHEYAITKNRNERTIERLSGTDAGVWPDHDHVLWNEAQGLPPEHRSLGHVDKALKIARNDARIKGIDLNSEQGKDWLSDRVDVETAIQKKTLNKEYLAIAQDIYVTGKQPLGKNGTTAASLKNKRLNNIADLKFYVDNVLPNKVRGSKRYQTLKKRYAEYMNPYQYKIPQGVINQLLGEISAARPGALRSEVKIVLAGNGYFDIFQKGLGPNGERIVRKDFRAHMRATLGDVPMMAGPPNKDGTAGPQVVADTDNWDPADTKLYDDNINIAFDQFTMSMNDIKSRQATGNSAVSNEVNNILGTKLDSNFTPQ